MLIYAWIAFSRLTKLMLGDHKRDRIKRTQLQPVSDVPDCETVTKQISAFPMNFKMHMKLPITDAVGLQNN